ncbi:MAG: glycerol kinase, partial [Oscillospiraceae bacterium]|nr:glycerol kinase [Oscillospiraceae bacterium]
PEVNPLAESVPDSGGVILVPAFTGLGAPHWDMYARGALLGITRGTTKAHIARAALEGIAYQVTDMMNAMRSDADCEIAVLHVDGGASVSNLMMQIQSDLLRIPVERPKVVETTAFGAAALAGLYAGVWESLDEISSAHESERTFYPERPAADAEKDYNQWKRAVGRACGWVEK